MRRDNKSYHNLLIIQKFGRLCVDLSEAVELHIFSNFNNYDLEYNFSTDVVCILFRWLLSTYMVHHSCIRP